MMIVWVCPKTQNSFGQFSITVIVLYLFVGRISFGFDHFKLRFSAVHRKFANSCFTENRGASLSTLVHFFIRCFDRMAIAAFCFDSTCNKYSTDQQENNTNSDKNEIIRTSCYDCESIWIALAFVEGVTFLLGPTK